MVGIACVSPVKKQARAGVLAIFVEIKHSTYVWKVGSVLCSSTAYAFVRTLFLVFLRPRRVLETLTNAKYNGFVFRSNRKTFLMTAKIAKPFYVL